MVLDLNGDGINTLSYAEGVQFDLHETGKQVRTGWVTSGDGLLVLDRNGDGVINNGGELFGSSTTLASGAKAATGYEALADLDSNADGVIDSTDAVFANMKVWVDGNADGVSQGNELSTLNDLGITKLSLAAQTTSIVDNGNVVGLTSSFETSNGQVGTMADVWFVAQDAGSAAPVDLRSQVSGLTQAMSSFSQEQASAAVTLPTVGQTATSTSIASGVGSMVNAVQQFSSLEAGMNQAVSTTTLTTDPLLQDPSKTGILSTGGKG